MIVSLGRELLCRADISKDGAETLHFGQEQSLGVGTGRVIGAVSLNKLVCAS